MKIIKVNLGKRTYPIVVGYDIIHSLGKFINKMDIGRDAYVITNNVIKSKYGKILEMSLKAAKINVRFKTIPDTEKSKSIKIFSSLLADLASFDKQKRVFVVALGGGVIGDLSGFIAAVYKRGIPYIQIPTTLLAQIDSSIGGKTGIDLTQGKNLAGAFYQPRLVFSDIKFLKTLGIRQIRSGMAELIKYAVIKNEVLFNYLEDNYKKVLKLEPDALEYIVNCCSKIKAGIVELDEREEKGIRTVLNFGHTLAHAIEAALNYKSYTHGEAVGLGMLVAGDISCFLKLTDSSVAKRIENLIKSVGLPVKIKGVSLQKIINAHYHDKKFIGKKNRFVLIKEIGSVSLVENIPVKIIEQALRVRLF